METQKDRILAILREHQAELQAAGLLHLRLFGSTARGDKTYDVDLSFDYDESATRNLLHAYGTQEDVAELLGLTVHLSSATHMRPEIQTRARPEMIDVF